MRFAAMVKKKLLKKKVSKKKLVNKSAGNTPGKPKAAVKKKVVAKTVSKTIAKKKQVAKKAVVKKAVLKKKTVAKKPAVKKPAVKKAAVKKAAVKKAPARKPTTRSPAKSRAAGKGDKGLGLTYITRMDHGNTHGWWVRVYKDSKPVESKLFSDGVHGGKLKAKKLAQDHRDLVVNKHKIVPVHLRKTREHSVDKRSTSGVVGVTLSVAEKAGSLRVHWSARFMEKGRQRNVSFSVRKYGYEGAFRNALKVRFGAIESTMPRGLKPPAPTKVVQRWMKKQKIDL